MLVLHDLIVGYSGHRHKLGQAARLKPPPIILPPQYFRQLKLFIDPLNSIYIFQKIQPVRTR